MDNNYEAKIQELKLTEMIEKAENIVATTAAAAAVTGAVPIPFADMPLLIGEQVTMMAAICKVFEIDIKKDGLKALATAAISASGASIIGRTIATNALKVFPGGGTIMGGTVAAGTAGVVTLAMGKAFIEVCKACKMGKLTVAEITSAKGKGIMQHAYKESLKK